MCEALTSPWVSCDAAYETDVIKGKGTKSLETELKMYCIRLHYAVGVLSAFDLL